MKTQDFIDALTKWPRVEVEGDQCIVPPTWEDRWHADDRTAEITVACSTGLEAARHYVSTGDWGDEPGSVRVYVWREAIRLSDGEVVRYDGDSHDVDTPECQQDEPDCDGPAGEHDWQYPQEVVGGCDSNPGVYATGGTGGGCTAVCGQCGRYREETWSGSQRNPGDPSETTTYRDADDRSIRWLESEYRDEVLDGLAAAGMDRDDAHELLDSGGWWQVYVEHGYDPAAWAEAEERQARSVVERLGSR